MAKIPGKQILGDFLDFVSGSFRSRIQAKTLTADRIVQVPDKSGTIALMADVEDSIMKSLSKRVDDVDGVYYIGESVPGTVESSQSWRVKKVLTIDGDVVVLWADNGLFTQSWTDRLSLNYT